MIARVAFHSVFGGKRQWVLNPQRPRQQFRHHFALHFDAFGMIVEVPQFRWITCQVVQLAMSLHVEHQFPFILA